MSDGSCGAPASSRRRFSRRISSRALRYADDVRGLFYGYGYVVAEDRLYQMEMARRAVLGTVSEVMGPAYLALDKGSRASFSPDSSARRWRACRLDDAAISSTAMPRVSTRACTTCWPTRRG